MVVQGLSQAATAPKTTIEKESIEMRRTIKLFSMAAMAALALSAFVASAAQAGHTWDVNGVKLEAGKSETCKGTPDGTMTLHGVTSTGVTIHLTSTTFTTEECKITQVGSGATAEAVDSVKKITFGGITVDAPVGCKTSETIATNAVTSHVVTIEHPKTEKGGHPIVAFTTFNPTAATSGTFANVTLTGCAAAETYPVKGSVCAEMPQAGVLAIEQTIKFTATADEACATTGDKLTVGGGGAAILRGNAILELTGAAGKEKPWGFTAT